ncbi:MAG TPA: hypothetical protein VE178_20465 [Silvibacterium sp.]|jgi:hypothetical protein|nr:hypothetical protein [Silvibacterium sp.]
MGESFSFQPQDPETLESVTYNLPEDAKILIDRGENGIWITANRAGFLYMAKAFIEIAMSDLEDGWHTHRNLHLGHERVHGDEVTICLSEALEVPEER